MYLFRSAPGFNAVAGISSQLSSLLRNAMGSKLRAPDLKAGNGLEMHEKDDDWMDRTRDIMGAYTA